MNREEQEMHASEFACVCVRARVPVCIRGMRRGWRGGKEAQELTKKGEHCAIVFTSILWLTRVTTHEKSREYSALAIPRAAKNAVLGLG